MWLINNMKSLLGNLYFRAGILILIVLGVVIFLATRDQVAEPGIVDTPKIFAHRGASDRFNESTITAYQIAAEDGVDALELDLRMTKDNVLIVMHDETIDRTTNGKGKVKELTLKELQSFVTVGNFNNTITKAEIPTLEKVFQTFGSTQNYYIETRLVNGEAIMEDELVKLVEAYHLTDNKIVTIQSFSEKSLEKMAILAPEIPLTMLFGKGKFDLEKALSVKYPVIGLESSDANIKVINALHRKGKEVHVFFNNAETMEEEQKRMMKLNVDGYFTDNIHFTKQLLAN